MNRNVKKDLFKLKISVNRIAQRRAIQKGSQRRKQNRSGNERSKILFIEVLLELKQKTGVQNLFYYYFVICFIKLL